MTVAPEPMPAMSASSGSDAVPEASSGAATALAVAAPIAVGILAAALGIWRLLPGVGFWDTAEFQTVPPILGTAHPTGYPTYVLLCWLASAVLTPFGEAAFRMNLLSAILVGVACGITVDLVRVLTRSTILGVVAGLGLAATPIVWSIGTHADPHALHLAFVAAVLWALVRWERARREHPERADRWLLGAAALTGLSVGNHSLTLLLAPPIALYVLVVEPRILLRWKLVLACAIAVAKKPITTRIGSGPSWRPARSARSPILRGRSPNGSLSPPRNCSPRTTYLKPSHVSGVP